MGQWHCFGRFRYAVVLPGFSALPAARPQRSRTALLTYDIHPCDAVYATANVSGGHLNPAVTVATMVSGHIGPVAGVAYLIAQISGACLGILLEVRLTATC